MMNGNSISTLPDCLRIVLEKCGAISRVVMLTRILEGGAAGDEA